MDHSDPRVLRRQSQQTNVPVRVLAVQFLDQVSNGNGQQHN
jgi:hypothetical protein